MEQDRDGCEADDVADVALRSALELAVDVAASGARRHPPLAFPGELRPLLRQKRLNGAQLARVRRAVEADPAFFGHLAEVATTDLVDEAGLLWLRRPDGWRARLAELAGDGDGVARQQRRRAALEDALERERGHHLATRERLDRERQLRTATHERLEATEAALGEITAERDRLDGAVADLRARLVALHAERDAARDVAAGAEHRARAAESTRDAVLAARAADDRSATAAGGLVAVELDAVRAAQQRVQRALGDARDALGDAGRLLAEAGANAAATAPAPSVRTGRRRDERPRRQPVPVPGGVFADSATMAEFLLKLPGIVVLVDGYNVAMLGWPGQSLEVQRERLVVTAEDIARRWGTDVAIVFDGADVPGASAPRRRLVRVVFSPVGLIADDVLRVEVGALPLRQPVLVVTNDQAVLADVRAAGANTISSDQFLAVARR